MAAFWSGVVAASLLAMLIVLVPLWWLARRQRPARRLANLDAFAARAAEIARDLEAGLIDESSAAALRTELERGLLRDASGDDDAVETPDAGRGDWRLPVLASVLVPALGLAAYLPHGALDDVLLARDIASAEHAAAEGGHAGEDARALMARLRARLVRNPDDADGWFLLGRTALSVSDFALGVEAFERLRSLVPDEPAVPVYLLQALYLADGREVTDRVRAVAEEVLASNPHEPITREILAMDAFRHGRYRTAIDHLEQALRGGVDAERRAFLQRGIAAARERLGEAPPSQPGDGPAYFINVRLDASPEVRERFTPDTTVFVLARGTGSPMPLAVVRRTLGELPLEVRLDDTLAMTDSMKLSAADRVEVVARISPSGQASRGPDDVEVRRADVPTDAGATLDLTFGGPAASQLAGAGTVDRSPVALKVLVELGAGITGLDPDTTVFVFARDADGPPVPLAARRLTVADLPALVTLTDADAMMPGRTLSAARVVRIGARVSRSGSVTAAAGDVQGFSEPVEPNAQQRVISVIIDEPV